MDKSFAKCFFLLITMYSGILDWNSKNWMLYLWVHSGMTVVIFVDTTINLQWEPSILLQLHLSFLEEFINYLCSFVGLCHIISWNDRLYLPISWIVFWNFSDRQSKSWQYLTNNRKLQRNTFIGLKLSTQNCILFDSGD